jgi:hypothetical protein
MAFRSVGLARAAAEAEVLHLKLLGRRTARRGVVGVVAAVFAIAALAWLHVALVLWLAASLGGIGASVVLMGADLVLAGVLGLVALSNRPDSSELQAKMLRESAWRGLRQDLALAGVMATLSNLLRKRGSRE